ncbi:MAG: DegT/DnrJ/EryC1/StrS aminotransferase family protein [Candidatus Hydrogenedentota bacterium]
MKKIRLSKSVVGIREKKALSKVIDHSYLGMGDFVKEFEEKLKVYLKREVVCVNSGTAALHLALMALNLNQGAEVLVQSLTYVATYQAIKAAGYKPVSCEIVPQTCTIDLDDAKRKITDKTKVILPVHYAGRTGNLEQIYNFARKYNLHVVEDAAHAFGTIYKNKKIGSFGEIVCFSFDGIKNITSGEGGAVVTSDNKVLEYVRDARLLGVHKDTEKRYNGKRSWEFDVFFQGYRYHMSNLFAAIGIVQLARFEKEFKIKRQILAKNYHKRLSKIKDIELFPDDYDRVVPHIFPIRILNNKRDRLRGVLEKHNIETGIHYYPNHLLSYFRNKNERLPVTERIYKELISLPLHPELTKQDQDRIIKILKKEIERL